MDCLTPSILRLDKKCGASAIAKNKTCRKGAGGVKKERASRAGRTEKWQKRIGTGLHIAGTAAGLAGIITENHELTGAGNVVAGIGSNVYGRGLRRQAKRTGKRGLETQAEGTMASGAVQAALGTGVIGASMKLRRRARETAKRASQYEHARRASAWARNAAGEDWAGRAGYRRRRPGGGEAPPPRNSYKGDPFKDLGVDPKASDAEIKKAYARAARANHPDLGGDAEKMKKINAAYEAIKRRRGRKDDFTLDCLTAEGVLTI